jgi:hypothetical protein
VQAFGEKMPSAKRRAQRLYRSDSAGRSGRRKRQSQAPEGQKAGFTASGGQVIRARPRSPRPIPDARSGPTETPKRSPSRLEQTDFRLDDNGQVIVNDDQPGRAAMNAAEDNATSTQAAAEQSRNSTRSLCGATLAP